MYRDCWLLPKGWYDWLTILFDLCLLLGERNYVYVYKNIPSEAWPCSQAGTELIILSHRKGCTVRYSYICTPLHITTKNKPDKSKNKTRQMGRKIYNAYRRFLGMLRLPETLLKPSCVGFISRKPYRTLGYFREFDKLGQICLSTPSYCELLINAQLGDWYWRYSFHDRRSVRESTKIKQTLCLETTYSMFSSNGDITLQDFWILHEVHCS